MPDIYDETEVLVRLLTYCGFRGNPDSLENLYSALSGIFGAEYFYEYILAPIKAKYPTNLMTKEKNDNACKD